jgi:hypothetical protein
VSGSGVTVTASGRRPEKITYSARGASKIQHGLINSTQLGKVVYLILGRERLGGLVGSCGLVVLEAGAVASPTMVGAGQAR